MPTLRYATSADAALITGHRHQMFADNHFTTEQALLEADAEFEPWVRQRLEDGRYLGLLLEDAIHEGATRVIAGAGIFFADFPPHWIDPQPVRAYVLNVYTLPEARSQGLATLLMQAVLTECRRRDIPTIVLHASPFGRPVYERLGFAPSDEMMLRLNAAPS